MHVSNNISLTRKKFLITLLLIVVFGIMMVLSSSYIYSKEVYEQGMLFFVRQLIFLVFSCFLAFIVNRIKFNFWIRYSMYINIICLLFLIFTLVPGIGVGANGANRWISIGFLNFQPGEIIKYTLVLLSVFFFENYSVLENKNKVGCSLLFVLSMIILLLQPDFGTFTICFVIISSVCFLSSFTRRVFYYGLSLGVLLFSVVLIAQPYRLDRLLSFLDPWKNSQTTGFQVIQSYLAFANGSFFGQGLGNSNEKLFYLPEAHNDFIFSVIGEELGFLGVFILISIYGYFLFQGFKLSLIINDRVKSITIASITFAIGFQIIMNMGVVLGLLPTKGLNLPFISSGGSSLVANFFGIGLILSALRSESKINKAISDIYV